MALSSGQQFAVNTIVDDAFTTAVNTAESLALTRTQYRAIVGQAVEDGLDTELTENRELERVTLSNYNNLVSLRTQLQGQAAPASVITAIERAVYALVNLAAFDFLPTPSFPDPDA